MHYFNGCFEITFNLVHTLLILSNRKQSFQENTQIRMKMNATNSVYFPWFHMCSTFRNIEVMVYLWLHLALWLGDHSLFEGTCLCLLIALPSWFCLSPSYFFHPPLTNWKLISFWVGWLFLCCLAKYFIWYLIFKSFSFCCWFVFTV